MAAMVATGSRLSNEGSRLFRIRKTCLKMLQKRGYVVDEEQLDMTKETFIQTWGENPTRDAMARGVDWTSMAGSPPEAMSGTLEWLRSEHGSIDGYLASEMALGDGYEEWRRKLLNAVRLS